MVLSGSVPKSLPKDIYAQIAKLAQTKGVRLIVDAAGDLLLSTLEFQPFLVKPNREELSEMFRAPADTEEQVTALAEELKKRGAKNVLVPWRATVRFCIRKRARCILPRWQRAR